MLGAAARRLATSLSALASAGDSDEAELTEVTWGKLWCPIPSPDHVWSIDEHWFVVSCGRRLTLVAHLEHQAVRLPRRWARHLVQCFVCGGRDVPKRLVVASTGGALMSVTFDALHAVLHMPVPKDALKRKHCYQLSYQLMRGGRKKLCIVEPHWMVSASRNRVEWYRVDARATPTEVSMSKL